MTLANDGAKEKKGTRLKDFGHAESRHELICVEQTNREFARVVMIIQFLTSRIMLRTIQLFHARKGNTVRMYARAKSTGSVIAHGASIECAMTRKSIATGFLKCRFPATLSYRMRLSPAVFRE